MGWGRAEAGASLGGGARNVHPSERGELVSQADKRLEQMRRNPQGDWRIEDVEMVCAAFGVTCIAPKRGSHHTISHSTQADILTIPSRRPIKPVYIKLLVTYIDAVSGK